VLYCAATEEEGDLHRKLIFVLALAVSSTGFGGKTDDERAVRDLVSRWDAAYRSLDAGALAALETEDFEMVNRLGWWTPFKTREDNERMWAWTFKTIYNGKPGPKHTVERVRFISPDVAIVQAHGDWPALALPDGTAIPPHGEIVTLVVVKKKRGWLVASESIHNQMPGEELPSPLPWEPKGSHLN
jgi:uncharacterized protein (TIGR02246 family)